MKKLFGPVPLVFSALALFSIFGFTLTATALAQDKDIAEHPFCPYCGMNRQQFAHSRVYVQFDDGSSAGYCSIHCAAVDMAVNIDKAPVKIQVGDHDTKQLIDAETAIWVIGGSKPGVMTRRAKWAFGAKESAEAYVQANGGKTAGFEETMKASYEDMYEDTKMIRAKRKMKRMRMEQSKK